MSSAHATGAALALVAVLALVALLPVGSVGASHGEATNFTVQPATTQDRQPGIDDASYKSWTSADQAEHEGFKYLNYSVLIWEEGRLGACGPGDAKVAGIDRDNDDPGTHVDESVKDQIENNYATEDRVVIDFIDQNDPFGEPVSLRATDQFVSHVQNCRGNPAEPGWYQITGVVNGTTYSGEHAQYRTTSHYFWICDCQNEQEARRKLGPPPSERGSQSTATATGTATPGSGGQTTETAASTAAGGSTATATAGGRTRTAGATATTASGTDAGRSTTARATSGGSDGGGGGGGGGAAAASATPTPASWAANTPASGPGLGAASALAALGGLLVALARRR